MDTMSRTEQSDMLEDELVVVPIIEESVEVRTRKVETGLVRITKVVTEQQETVDAPLLADTVEIEHVPINRVVDAAPAVRHEGDTMIVPVMEEVLFVEKRLVLKEELHITRRQTETRTPQEVTLRREEAKIERIDTSDH